MILDKLKFEKHSDKVFRKAAQKSIKKLSELEKGVDKTVKVQWTPAFQSYYSAGDEAEPFCDKCEQILQDGYKYCPVCGGKLDWGQN